MDEWISSILGHFIAPIGANREKEKQKTQSKGENNK